MTHKKLYAFLATALLCNGINSYTWNDETNTLNKCITGLGVLASGAAGAFSGNQLACVFPENKSAATTITVGCGIICAFIAYKIAEATLSGAKK